MFYYIREIPLIMLNYGVSLIGHQLLGEGFLANSFKSVTAISKGGAFAWDTEQFPDFGGFMTLYVESSLYNCKKVGVEG